jgi:alpha-tubulin suppressor-like RCC1 family protein
VAGGGGGRGEDYSSTGGYGGGMTGGGGYRYNSSYVGGGGGTQAAGGAGGTKTSAAYFGRAGAFGVGGSAQSTTCSSSGCSSGNKGGGGGGGWFGGGGGTTSSNSSGGGGGSGYVLTATSDTTGYGVNIPDPKFQMTNTNTVAGDTTMPNPTGGDMVGRVGSGYAKITRTQGYSPPVVMLGGVGCTNVEVLSETKLTCITGEHAKGQVDVVVSDDSSSVTIQNGYNYYNQIKIYNVSPSAGLTTGGQLVTINGAEFSNYIQAVTIGGAECTNLNVISGTQLTCNVGASTEGLVDVTIDEGGNQGTMTNGFRYYAPMTVTGIDPDSGPTAGGTDVTIDGTGFSIKDTNFTQVTTGGLGAFYFACAIGLDGQAYCWGSNGYGALGNDAVSSSGVPIPVDTSGVLSGLSIKQISAGSYHTCVIASDDRVYCWGDNDDGQLGNNSNVSSTTPVAVYTTGALNGLTIKQISAGVTHTCAIASDDKVYCWGDDDGTPGSYGSGTKSTIPVSFHTTGALNGLTAKQVSAGRYQTCAIASDDNAYCWGWSTNYPKAVDTTGVLNGLTIKQVSAGINDVCAIASDDNVYCWSDGYSVYPLTAIDMTGALSGLTAKQVSVGWFQSCLIASDDNAYCWGEGGSGGLGNNSTADSSVPVAVDTSGVLNGLGVKQISSGASFVCAITYDAHAYCWGSNDYNQLGNGSTIDSLVPAGPVSGLRFTVAIGGVECINVEIVSTTEITCTTGAHVTGLEAVAVSDGLQSASLADAYTYIDLAPDINSITPNHGLIDGGTEVTILGQHFGNMPSSMNATTLVSYSTCGAPQIFAAPSDGTYRLEAWGASSGKADRGNGGYSKGELILNSGDALYVYVGCQGAAPQASYALDYVFNGGAYVHTSTGTGDSGGGGGATDFRLTDGDWDNADSLQSRILVAGGGGSGYSADSAYQSGGLNGGMNGGQNGVYVCAADEQGSFGKGGAYDSSDDWGGGGGGWYGGCSAGDNEGGGGSSYAFTSTSDLTGYGGDLPDIRYQLSNTQFVAGDANPGDGYARISLVEPPVMFDDAGCTVKSWSDTQITCTTSAHADGLVPITVSNGLASTTLPSGYLYQAVYVKLSLDDGSVQVDGGSGVTPTIPGVFVSSENIATVATNNLVGYALQISTNQPNSNSHASDMVHQSVADTYLSATENTCIWNGTALNSTNTALLPNTYGFTLDPAKLSDQKLCQIPNSTTPLTVKSTASDDETGDDTTIYYGVNVNVDQLAGEYKATIVYTAVANP